MFKRRRKPFAAGDAVAIYVRHESPYFGERAAVYPGRVESVRRGVVVVRGRDGAEMLGVFDLAAAADHGGETLLTNTLNLLDGGRYLRILAPDGGAYAAEMRRNAAQVNALASLRLVGERVASGEEVSAEDAGRAGRLLGQVREHLEARARV